jgi:hypothetical protein
MADPDISELRNRCTSFLHGHGPENAADFLPTIPADTEVDRYGEGGVLAELETEIARLLGKPAAGLPAERHDGAAGRSQGPRGPARQPHDRLSSDVPSGTT